MRPFWKEWNRSRLCLGVICLLMVLYICTFATLSFLRHDAFQTEAFDLGIYDHAIWNTLHGRPFRSTNEQGFDILLADHFQPILLLIAPLYLVWSDPKGLLLLQTVVIASGALPVFWLARERLGDDLPALVFPLAYLLSPALQAANLFDFHPAALAAALLLYAFYFLERKLYGWFFGIALLCMSCQEDVPLLVFMMGLYLFFIQKERKLGALTSGVAALWFYLAVFVIIPHFNVRDQSQYFVRLYSHLGEGPGQIMTALIREPHRLMEIILSRQRALYVLGSLLPFGFTSLLAPHVLLLALPSLVINLFSQPAYMYRLDGLHYGALIVPFVTASSIFGTSTFARWIHRWTRKATPWPLYGCSLVVLAFSLGYHRYHGLSPLAADFQCPVVTEHHRLARRFIAMIPPDAVLSAQGNLNPHLSQRETIYLWPQVEEAEYIFLDVSSLINKDDIQSWVRDTLLVDPDFGLMDAEDGYLLLRRGTPATAPPEDFARFARVNDPVPQYPMVVDFGDSLRFLGFDVHTNRIKLTQFHFNLYWQALREMDRDFLITLYLVDSEGNVTGSSQYPQPTCVWYPTSQWEPGETVKMVGNTFAWWTDEMDRFGVALGVVDGSNEWEVSARLRPWLVEAELVTRMPGDGTLLQFATFRNKLSLATSAPEKRTFVPPAMQHGIHADLDRQVRLLGYDLSPRRIQAGSTVHLTLYWQALARMKTSYTVFTHLLDGEGQARGGKDNVPLGGTYPTTAWLEGEVMRDEYEVPVAPDAPSGEYLLEVGMYDASTGERLGVLDESGQVKTDHILLGSIQVIDH